MAPAYVVAVQRSLGLECWLSLLLQAAALDDAAHPRRRWDMANQRFKILDSDIHIIEPVDLWPRYIDPAFRDRAPIGLSEDHGDLRLAWEGKPWGRVSIDADRSRRR